jgi:pectate lyase
MKPTRLLLPILCLGACSYSGQHVVGSEGGIHVSITAQPPGMAVTVTPSCDGVDPAAMPSGLDAAPIGWASVDDAGQNGTTGGAGGALVLATTLAELQNFVGRTEPLIIAFCGLLGTGVERVEPVSHKTLVGVGTRPTLRANVDLDGASNVVIQNLFIEATDPDGISLRRSHHVWIDHVDISDAADGNLDISDQSNYVTVSFSSFWYRDPSRAHRFSNLIGSGDDNVADSGLLKVTLHHNWWADNVVERMPRTRYGDIHVFNNLYTSRNNNYCIRSGVSARLLVENNFFWMVKDPVVLDGGQVLQRGNALDFTTGSIADTKTAFTPPYSYPMDPADTVPTLVTEMAGPG